jgi:hypothetical protein
MLRRIFQVESSTSNFTGRGTSARIELPGWNLTREGVNFTLDQISTEEFSIRGGYISMSVSQIYRHYLKSEQKLFHI